MGVVSKRRENESNADERLAGTTKLLANSFAEDLFGEESIT